MDIFKKFLVFITISVLILPASIGRQNDSITLHLNEAQAITVTVLGGKLDFVMSLPSIDGQIAAISASSAVTATQTTAETTQSLFEWAQSFVLETLKKRLLDEIVADIVRWIQGGGEPRFVTDWDAFLNDAVDVAIGDFAQELGLGFLCRPFGDAIRLSLPRGSAVRTFRHRASCTLDDIVNNIEGFYHDFEQGGWVAFNAAWEPQNNFFGSYVISQEELSRRAFRAEQAAQSEAIAGGGFLSTYTCKENPASNAFDKDRDGIPGDYDCKITTPGSTIGGLVSKAVGVDIDYILSADQLSEYVSAIANVLINRLIRTGTEGLAGLSNPDNPGSDFVTSAGPCASLSGAALAACISYVGSSAVSFSTAKANLLSNINASLQPRQEAQTVYEAVLVLLADHLIYLTSESDNGSNSCVPGGYFEIIQGAVETITEDAADNSETLTALAEAKIKVEALRNNNWSGLSQIQADLEGTFNPILAQLTKDEAELAETAVEEEIEKQKETVEDDCD